MYVVLTVGFATTFDAVLLLSVNAGFQLYVLAPLTLILVDEPIQIVPLVVLKFGNGFTITVLVAILLQPLASTPVTVYSVVVIGLAITLAVTLLLSVVAGVQV